MTVSRAIRRGILLAALAVAPALVAPVAAQALGYSVTVDLTGAGTGSVISSPAGIECSNIPGKVATSCSHSFPGFTKLKLTATADTGSVFNQWSGKCTGYVNTCEFTTAFFGGATVNAEFVPPPEPPSATTVAATEVSFWGATLNGEVNPNGFRVASCTFEYGQTAAYGHTVPCTPTSLGEGTAPVAVTAPANTPLQPETTYHYRVVASNLGGTGAGQDQTFTTGSLPSDSCPNARLRAEQASIVQFLPECRAYEMVSPLQKGGSDILTTGILGFPIAENGEAVGFLSQTAFGDAENALSGAFSIPENRYIARRAVSGWLTSSALPPRDIVAKPGLGGIDATPEGLTRLSICGMTVVNNATAAAGSAVCALGGPEAWTATPDYANTNGMPYQDYTGNSVIKYVGSSAGLSHVVFEADHGAATGAAFLTTDTSTYEGDGLYEVTGMGGSSPQLRLINVNNRDEEIGPNAASRVAGISNAAGEAIGCHGIAGSPYAGSSYHAISSDGTTIYFTACPSNIEGGADEVFARIDGTHTVAVSDPAEEGASECEACDSTPRSAVFEGASADGSKVFFTTTQPLLSIDEGGTGLGNDLYEYDFNNPSGKHLVDLSRGGPGDLTPGSGAEVQGVVTTASDGSHVYFVAQGVLTTVPNARGETAVRGADNLYAVDTSTLETKFVAELCSNAGMSGTSVDSQCPATLSGTTNDTALWGAVERQAQTTPSGRYLVFTTYGRLITSGAEADTDEAKDVYRYDFQSGELVRVSVGEPSFPASDNGNTPGMNAEISGLPVGGVGGGDGAHADINDLGRAVSDNGETIVFRTPEPLQANDVNTGANPSCGGLGTGCDVYEWHDGTVSMISPGDEATNGEEAGVAGISASGRDIFFLTRTQLVGQDSDQLVDVYDARVQGGFPAPTPEPSCSGEECQGAPSMLPAFEAPGSVSFTGGANLTPPPEKTTTGKAKPKAKPQKSCKAKFKHVKNKKKRHHKVVRCKRQRHKGKASRLHHKHHAYHHHRGRGK